MSGGVGWHGRVGQGELLCIGSFGVCRVSLEFATEFGGVKISEKSAEEFLLSFRVVGKIWASGGRWGRRDDLLIVVSRWSRRLLHRRRRGGGRRRRRLSRWSSEWLLGLATRCLIGPGLVWRCRGLPVVPTAAARRDRHSDRDGPVQGEPPRSCPSASLASLRGAQNASTLRRGHVQRTIISKGIEITLLIYNLQLLHFRPDFFLSIGRVP